MTTLIYHILFLGSR